MADQAISEVKLDLNSENGQSTETLSVRKKKLNSVIITSTEKISLIINSSIGYNILHIHEHEGVKYYCPRAVMRQPTENLKDHTQFTKFVLNEELDFILNGPAGADVEVILRFC